MTNIFLRVNAYPGTTFEDAVNQANAEAGNICLNFNGHLFYLWEGTDVEEFFQSHEHMSRTAQQV